MALANVAITNTFNEFRIRVNEVITILNSISGGGGGGVSVDTVEANSISTGQIVANNLSAGGVLFASGNSLIVTDSGITFNATENSLSVLGKIVSANLTANNLTSGRVVIVGENGLITDNGTLTYDSGNNNFVVTGNISSSNLTSGRVLIAGASGLVTDNSNLTYDTTTGVLTAPVIEISDTTDASNLETGALQVEGGASIKKKLFVGDQATFFDSVEIQGNLTVIGNTITLDVQNFRVDDPIILLANTNTSDVLDIGFVAHYSANQLHTGLIRHADDGKYYLFDGYEEHFLANNEIDPTNPTFGYADLKLGELSANSIVANGIIDTSNTLVTVNSAQTLLNKTLEQPIIVEGTEVISANTTASVSNSYILTASVTLTLPSSPNNGDWVRVSNRSGTITPIIARNGSRIMGLEEDMTIDARNVGITLLYADSTRGWIIL
jgi:hypothetical protein